MNVNLNSLTSEIMRENLETIAPNFRKSALSSEDINRIIERIANDIGVSRGDALAGTILLMLKGAASGGTPQSLSVDLRDGKTLAKKNIYGAYVTITGNSYIRRLAESIAVNIGEFAEHYSLNGELAHRINTVLKAETGEILTPKEMAWCSSFSQNLPDLASRSSERLVQLLAEDYKKRFEQKKKTNLINRDNNLRNNIKKRRK